MEPSTLMRKAVSSSWGRPNVGRCSRLFPNRNTPFLKSSSSSMASTKRTIARHLEMNLVGCRTIKSLKLAAGH